jgi:hypothetical protein
VDIEKLHVALRRLGRGHLLMVAERAIEMVPKAKLLALVGDMVRLDQQPPPRLLALFSEITVFSENHSRRSVCWTSTRS